MTDPSPESALAECPFCGRDESLYVEHVEGTILHPSYYVRCDYCGAVGPSTDKGDHVEIWNRRTHGAHFAALAGRLAEAEQEVDRLNGLIHHPVHGYAAVGGEAIARAERAEAERDDLRAAAERLIEAVDNNHDTKPAPQRYTVPWKAVTDLRAALTAALQRDRQP